MGRLVKELQLNQSLDVVSIVMEDYVYHHRFTRSYWNDEMVYCSKDSYGGEHYIKWSYICGVFHLEAWTRNSFGREASPYGLGGGPGKREFRDSIGKLLTMLKQNNTDYANGHMNSDPIHHEEQHGDNHRKWKADTKWQSDSSQEKDANADAFYVIAWIAVVFALFSPFVGFVLAQIAMNKGKNFDNSNKIRKVATLAIILSISSLGLQSFWELL